MTIYQDVVDHVLGALDEAEADRRRALKRADAFALDTQTCDEAVQSLCEMIVAARAERDELRAALGATPIATTADVARTLSKMRACPACKRLTRDTTAGCDHCELEDK
jgi:hypothetical protein